MISEAPTATSPDPIVNLCERKKLEPGPRALFETLCRRFFIRGKLAFMTQRTLAREFRRSPRTIMRWERTLESAGLIQRSRYRAGRAWRRTMRVHPSFRSWIASPPRKKAAKSRRFFEKRAARQQASLFSSFVVTPTERKSPTERENQKSTSRAERRATPRPEKPSSSEGLFGIGAVLGDLFAGPLRESRTPG